MEIQVWMASKEVADRLDVHVRTLRNWLDMFVPVIERMKNPQGHYLISETGFALLREVKERKDDGNTSLRDIQRQLIQEGKLSKAMLCVEEVASAYDNLPAVKSSALQSAVYEVEVTVQESLIQFRQELVQLGSLHQLQSSILQKISDIEEIQESLRLEMRRVTFEMDLMQQRLTRRKQRHDRHQPRWSLNPFRWFTRSDRSIRVE